MRVSPSSAKRLRNALINWTAGSSEQVHSAGPQSVHVSEEPLLDPSCVTCLAAFLVLAALLLDPSGVALDVFGLDVSGTYGVQQPAAGFLQLAATLMPLESALLLLLASSVLEEASSEMRARISAAIILAGAGVMGTCAAATAGGLNVVDPAAVAAVLALCVVSGASVLRPLLREQSPAEIFSLYSADFRSLLPSAGGSSSGSGDDATGDAIALFYRGSCLASIVVGGAFAFSPISPLAVYEAEVRWSPLTHYCRRPTQPTHSPRSAAAGHLPGTCGFWHLHRVPSRSRPVR